MTQDLPLPPTHLSRAPASWLAGGLCFGMATPFSFLETPSFGPHAHLGAGPLGLVALPHPSTSLPPGSQAEPCLLGSPQGPLLFLADSATGDPASVMELHLHSCVFLGQSSFLASLPLVLGRPENRGPAPSSMVWSPPPGSLLGLPLTPLSVSPRGKALLL